MPTIRLSSNIESNSSKRKIELHLHCKKKKKKKERWKQNLKLSNESNDATFCDPSELPLTILVSECIQLLQRSGKRRASCNIIGKFFELNNCL